MLLKIALKLINPVIGESQLSAKIAVSLLFLQVVAKLIKTKTTQLYMNTKIAYLRDYCNLHQSLKLSGVLVEVGT